MTSVTRAAAVLLLLLASACSSTADTASATDSTGGASADELKSGARFTSRKKPADASLAALYAAGGAFDNAYRGVYRFNKAGPEATDPVARMNRVKEVMHRYMCSFFDESIDIGRSSGVKEVDDTMASINFDYYTDNEDAKISKVRDALKLVVKNDQLDLMSGGASGNNTSGELMGVYDIAHNEVLYFGFTNCGSDN